MSLSPQVTASLCNLKGFSGPGVQTVHWNDGGQVDVAVEFSIVDTLSCAIRSLRVKRTALRNATSDELKAWAGDVARRVSYLLEPLAVLEFDSSTQTVLVRSQPPTQRPDEIVYYEALVQAPGELSLMRYATPKSNPARQPVDMQITHELLLRLVDDVAS